MCSARNSARKRQPHLGRRRQLAWTTRSSANTCPCVQPDTHNAKLHLPSMTGGAVRDADGCARENGNGYYPRFLAACFSLISASPSAFFMASKLIIPWLWSTDREGEQSDNHRVICAAASSPAPTMARQSSKVIVKSTTAVNVTRPTSLRPTSLFEPALSSINLSVCCVKKRGGRWAGER